MIRMGALKDFFPIEFPYIPHTDVSGVIEKLGELVKELKEGNFRESIYCQ